MDIIEKMTEARMNGELKMFLCGEGKYQIESSQYTPGVEPTDVGKVLSRAIYKLYNNDPQIKEEYEKVLLSMIMGSAFDVYMVILYVMSQMFKEKNELSPFRLDMHIIFPKLQKVIVEKKEELKKGIVYPNGFFNKFAWMDIERFDRVCKEEYGLQLLI